MSRPITSRSAARSSPRKWLSIHPRVKSFGTTTTNTSSLNDSGSADANQVA